MAAAAIIPERLQLLSSGAVKLKRGGHSSPDDGVCFNEAVAWLTGLPHTSAPPCVSPVIRTFTIELNDRWSDQQRQALAPFAPRVVGTAWDGQDEARSYLALDWLVRSYTPAWLDLAGLSAEAAALRDLRRIVDLVAAKEAGPAVREARGKADAAKDAAKDAAGDAAKDAAWDAAKDAAWDAAKDAAWVAAWVAAKDAAKDAAGDAAWVAAWVAAKDAAWDAAWDALRPTVEALQASALELLDRMIDPSKAVRHEMV